MDSIEDPYMLVWAANNGDLAEVQALLDSGSHNVDECDEDGSTALVAAAWSNHADIVRLLLERGADINAQNATHRWTALHAAASKGHQECVDVLLQGVKRIVPGRVPEIVKADPFLLDYAQKHEHEDVAECIITKTQEFSAEMNVLILEDSHFVNDWPSNCVVM